MTTPRYIHAVTLGSFSVRKDCDGKKRIGKYSNLPTDEGLRYDSQPDYRKSPCDKCYRYDTCTKQCNVYRAYEQTGYWKNHLRERFEFNFKNINNN
jgi:hypothetical protein